MASQPPPAGGAGAASQWLLAGDLEDNSGQGGAAGESFTAAAGGTAHPSPPSLPSLLCAGWAGAAASGHTAVQPRGMRRQRSLTAGLGTQAEKLVGDSYKEEHRRDARTTFNFLRWKQHRSSKRYLRHMLGPLWRVAPGVRDQAFSFPSKLRMLAGPMLYVLLVTTAVAAYHALAETGRVPLWPGWNIGNNAPFGLTSFALSLLLVFRTNASYARWMDARRAWGSVSNRSRDLVRQGLAYFPADQPQLQAALCRWVVAFSCCLMCSLREDGDEAAALQHVLLPDELAALLEADHRPNYALQALSAVIAQAQRALRSQEAAACHPAVPGLPLLMDPNRTSLEDSMGTCERILRTPIPLAYTRHTSRFMIIWLTLLPFTLWDSCRWAMLPLCACIAFLLLGIEEIGVSIEEPFSILPLEHITGTIERNTAELYRLHAIAGSLAFAASGGAPTSGTGSAGAAAAAPPEGPAEGCAHPVGWM